MGERSVVLLRGINVGGRNRVPMADLSSTFVDAGFGDVRTYIQSGNVVLSAGASGGDLEAQFEQLLEARFGFPIPVVVRSADELREVVRSAPDVFGAPPGEYHCDVAFLKDPLTPAGALEAFGIRDGVDQAWPGAGVVYFARLSARRTQSRMSKVVGRPEYRLMTIRNWATTTTLLTLL